MDILIRYKSSRLTSWSTQGQNQDRVRAQYRDGGLIVTLPKVEEIKARAIKIDVQ